MARRILISLFVLAAFPAGGAAAQDGTLERAGEVDAAEYIRELLTSDNYDPRDRQRALNGARQLDSHWRSSIFDGRRTRATHGTGLRLPDLSDFDGTEKK